MSAQFGRWNLDGKPVERAFVDGVRDAISAYGPDGGSRYTEGPVGIVYQAFHTTTESWRALQPYILPSGTVLTWDGRLDNRAELVDEISAGLNLDAADIEIVAAAYDRWSMDCFGRLIGDWALAIWDPKARTLVLAKDLIGTRHLYYYVNAEQITWSTVLDPLVAFAQCLKLCEEYVAGWFSLFPAAHLTPFEGIHSVPPSSFVVLRPGSCVVRKYWDFNPDRSLHYGSDSEYEEHFREVFSNAVRRRLRSDTPILAELSGGMDSSSIVCMADKLLAQREVSTPRIDTLSYCSDSEPNWDERPYFTEVEAQRGRQGRHIDVTQSSICVDTDRLYLMPGAAKTTSAVTREFEECVYSNGNRVLLSGVGGDEVTGGVPTPSPELEDLVARAKFRQLAHLLKAWALNKRKPWFFLLGEALHGFLPQSIVGTPQKKQPPAWLNVDFVKRHRAALLGYPRRLLIFGPLPSFQENMSTLDVLRRQLACSALPSEPTYEKRYPFLDRDLLEFLYSVPREQLVRPGYRRFLMRRALAGIVPDALLNRKRKASVSRSPRTAISEEWPRLVAMTQNLLTQSLGIVDPTKFTDALHKARHGQEMPIVPLIRTLAIEQWLRNLTSRGVLHDIQRVATVALTADHISTNAHNL